MKDDAKKYLVSLDEIAELLEVTPRRVNQLVKTDAFPRATKGKYDIAAAFRWMKAKLDASEHGDTTEREEKTRGIRLQNEIRDMEVKQRRGELIPESIVIPELERIHNAVKTKMMAIGNDISLELAHIDDPPKIKTVIDGAIIDALNELDETGKRIATAVRNKQVTTDDSDLFATPVKEQKKPSSKRKVKGK